MSRFLVAGSAALAERVCAWLQSVGRLGAAAEEQPPRAPRPLQGRLWEPNALVAAAAAELPCGAALDLGCGTGRDAVYLASCGWQVTAIDVLPDALARGRDLEQRYAARAAPIDWRACDLERTPVEFEPEFNLIVMVRYVHQPLFHQLHSWLAPGGGLVCESFTMLHRQRHGKPADAARTFAPGQLPRLVQPLVVKQYDEAWRGTVHTARLWAQRSSE